MAPEANTVLLQLLAALDMELKYIETSRLYQVIDCQSAETMGQSYDRDVAAIIALRKLRRSYDALRALQDAIRKNGH